MYKTVFIPLSSSFSISSPFLFPFSFLFFLPFFLLSLFFFPFLSLSFLSFLLFPSFSVPLLSFPDFPFSIVSVEGGGGSLSVSPRPQPGPGPPPHWLPTPGGYSTLVWVGVCRWDFWNATHPCTHFEGKVTHPCTKNQKFSLKFAPFWRKFRKILKSWPIKVPNLRHFGSNFRKFWKIDPSKYHVFEKKGPIDVPGGLILLPMFAAHPYNHFCTEYPPGYPPTGAPVCNVI